MAVGCDICLKHQGKGPLTGELVGREDGFRVYHAMPDEDGFARLGWLFIESERHVPFVADLHDDEAAALGALRTRVAHALRDELGAEFVLTFVIGLGISHFHEHLVPRMPGTSTPWYESADVLPKADARRVAELCARLRSTIRLAVD